ncbi:MAG TPA: hypothetical protein ENN19_10505 [Chloroflexi bacterium]|nr:hypothetical protein [Chloroflexota bacterium]
MKIAPKSTFHISRLTRYALLLVLLLLAFFLRFYRLDAQSFWNDEGNSARIAERPIRLILEGAAGDIHPPGYYLLLHYWRAAVGHSEFALRALSAMCGVIMVAFTYLLGHRLFESPTGPTPGPTPGLVAAFLGAISPLAVYYAQEARMYALLGALSAVSTYLFLRLLARPSLAVGFAYVLVGAAGLYTQYAFPFVLIVHNVVFGLWCLIHARRARRLVLWAGLQVAVAALYLPWLPTALKSVTGWSPAGRSYTLIPALLDILRALTVGVTLTTDRAIVALISAGLLLAIALWPAWRERRSAAPSFPRGAFNVFAAAVYLLLPIVLILAFDLYKSEWLKFLIVILPPFHVLLARAVHRTPSSILSLALLTAFCIPTTISLHSLYFDPAYQRDDYRQIAADVAAQARPQDGIILNAPNQWEVFTYYHPDRHVYPAPYHPTPENVDAFLSPVLADHRRLFVLYWGDAEADPQRLVESALSLRAYKAHDRWYGRVRLAIYGAAALPQEPCETFDARFGDRILLLGYALAGGDDPFRSGDVVPLTLFWRARAPIDRRYKVTVQILDAQGRLVAQRDTEPRDDLLPTTAWTPEQTVTDRYGVWLPPTLSPGDHTLFVGLYDVFTGQRLPITAGVQTVDELLPLFGIHVESP